MTEYHDGIGPGRGSLRRKNQPALKRRNTEHREKVSSDERRLDGFGFSVDGEPVALIFESGETAKDHSGLIGENV